MFGPFSLHAPVAAPSDPYNLVPPVPFIAASNTKFPDYNNTNGKTQVSAATLSSQTTGVIIIAGQSLVTNVVPTNYTSVSSLNQNFSITNGGCFVASGTQLGCTGYAPNLPTNPWPTSATASWIGDQLIGSSIFQRVITVPIGVGGSVIADWAVGGANNPRIAVAQQRLASVGLIPAAFLWEQGESDNLAGTTQSAYTTGLNSLISTVHSVFWSSLPIFVAQATFINNTTSSAIRAAQAASWSSASFIIQGPDCDSLGLGFRQSDQTHWNATSGASAVAGLWVTSLVAYGTPF